MKLSRFLSITLDEYTYVCDNFCSFTCVEFKDARYVSFRSDLFTSYILTLFKQWNLLP